jgi:hypothetical protein
MTTSVSVFMVTPGVQRPELLVLQTVALVSGLENKKNSKKAE